MRQFTTDFHAALTTYKCEGPPLQKLLVRIENAFMRHGHRLPLPQDKSNFDLEVLYEFLFAINRCDLPTSRPFTSLPESPSRGRASQILEFLLKGYIQKRCLEPVAHPDRVEYLKPLSEFARLYGTLNVATLNYDACIETAAKLDRIPCHTGFDPRDGTWKPSLLGLQGTPSHPIYKLLKLHGSASWYRNGPFGVYREILKGSPREAGLVTGRARSLVLEAGLLIYPIQSKLPLMGPLVTLMATFQQMLSTADLCIIGGYRLADNHIRQIVLDQLRCNQGLRLLILSPTQTEVLGIVNSLLKEQGEPLRPDRITTRVKKFEDALRGGWLLNVAQRLIATPLSTGKAVPVEYVSKLRRRLSSRSPFATQPAWGIILDEARGFLYVTTGEDEHGTSALWRLNINSRDAERVASGLKRPRLPALEPDGSKLYLPENHYRTLPGEDPSLSNLRGLGRLWEISTASGAQRPLTSWDASGLSTSQIRTSIENPQNRSWLAGKRPLSWPTSAMVLDPHRQLLLTESRSLMQVDLLSGKIRIIPIPLALNIYGAQKMSPQEAIMLDAGVWDAELGNGQLYRLSLPKLEPSVFKRIGPLRPKACGFALSPDHKRMFITHRFAFPNGTVVEIDLRSGATLREWCGLHLPQTVAFIPGQNELIVATQYGLRLLKEAHRRPVVRLFE